MHHAKLGLSCLGHKHEMKDCSKEKKDKVLNFFTDTH